MKRSEDFILLKVGKLGPERGRESFKVRQEDLALELIGYITQTVTPSLVHHHRLRANFSARHLVSAQKLLFK